MVSPVLRARAEELVRRIERAATSAAHAQKAGTPLTRLKLLCKGLPRPDHELALLLRTHPLLEARQMAALLADPARMTLSFSDEWVSALDGPELCDFCAVQLFAKTKTPLKLAERWIKKEKEWTRRTGFMLLAALAAPRSAAPEAELSKFFPFIKNHAADARPAVYKAVNRALRITAKKSPRLAQQAKRCAEDILDLFTDNQTACWVAKNALFSFPASAPKTAGRK